MGGEDGHSLTRQLLASKLPKVEAWRTTPANPEPRGVEETQYERFGYNDIDEVWQPTPTYARWVQPSQEELARQVEFDLDDAGRIWLAAVNADRKKEGIEAVSHELFEIVLDKLEKEWFDVSKHFPKPASSMLVEDSKCTICDDGECEASNAIVFCDGCNLAVHQDCYGVPYIPEGQWLCRKCTVSPGRSVSCVLCPNKEGAFKQTVNGQWAHLVCAIWINETWVSNTVFMEPIDGIESIPKQRWRLICNLCRKRAGACIQCSKSSCYTAYHVTCAQKQGLYLKLGTSSGATTTEDSGGANISFCDKHSHQLKADEDDDEDVPAEETERSRKKRRLLSHGQRHASSTPAEDPEASTSQHVSMSKEKSTALSRSVEPESPKKKKKRKGPKVEVPIIPRIVHDRVWDYIKPLRLTKKRAFVAMAERYWSLLRKRRRGAPLLKRLHLEPWTASAGAPREATDLQREQTLQLTIQLRIDLDKVRHALELIRRREEYKLQRAKLIKDVVDKIFFPQTALFRATLTEIRKLDPRQLFLKPVSKADVPDYFDIVKHPMDWEAMEAKLDRNAYMNPDDFEADVKLIIHNALLYNTVDSTHGKAALKLRNGIEPLLAKVRTLNDPDSELYRKYRRYLDTIDDAYIDSLMSFDYPLPQDLPNIVSTPTADQLAIAPDMAPSLLPRDGIPDILSSLAGPSSLVPPMPARPSEANLHSAAGFKAPRDILSSLGIIRESAGPSATELKAAEKAARMAEREAAKEAIREKKREQNRAYRARAREKKQAEKAAREREAIIAAGGDPDALRPAPLEPAMLSQAPILEQASSHAPTASAMPSLPDVQDGAEVNAVPATSTPKLEVDEQDPFRSPSLPAMAVPPSHQPPAAQPSSSTSTALDAFPNMHTAVPRINSWGAAIDRIQPPNDHEANLLFNEGWILPEGSKRRRASSANTESSGPANRPRTSSATAPSVSPMFAPVSLPASAPTLSVPLPTLPELSSSPDLSDLTPGEVDSVPPEPGQGPDSIMQAKSEQEPTVIPEQGTNDLTRGVEDMTSDLTDVEEDMAAMQEDTDVKMSNAEGKGGEVVSTSPEVAALVGDLNQSNAVAEVGQVLERLGEHSESPAPPSAEPVESELSDLAEDSDVDGIENDVDQKQESAKANSKAPPSRKPRSSSARHAPPSKSAARDGEKSDAPRSKRRSSTREVAPPVNGLVEHPDDEAIVAKKEIESKSNTKPVSSKTASQSETASPVKRRPGRKPAKKQTKRGAKESAPQKFRPSVTVSKKTLASIYENAPLSFVEKRLRLLLPHVRYQNFDEVQDYDLVWARPNRQSAYWPAEVCLDVEERDGDVPQVVLDADPNKDGANKREESSERSRSPSKAPRSGDASMSDRQKRTLKHYEHYLLVQWFPQEAKSSWSWIPFDPEFVTQMGESKEYDCIMQTRYSQLVKRNKKAQNEPKRIQDAYDDAFRNMQTPPASDDEEGLQELGDE